MVGVQQYECTLVDPSGRRKVALGNGYGVLGVNSSVKSPLSTYMRTSEGFGLPLQVRPLALIIPGIDAQLRGDRGDVVKMVERQDDGNPALHPLGSMAGLGLELLYR